jgi:phosphoribosylglycinamide formyltransferase-1
VSSPKGSLGEGTLDTRVSILIELICVTTLSDSRWSPLAADEDNMPEHFISEAIEPVVGTIDTARMAPGAPGLPREFRWRRETINIVKVLKAWHDTGPCRNGSEEKYVRKHWFQVETSSGTRMKIYFERQSRSGRTKSRWWLFSIEEPDAPVQGLENSSGSK